MAAITLLQTKDLCKSFGGLQAVKDVNFQLKEGDIHALIGPNGAGKTTFVSLLSGRLKPSNGTISFQGKDITTTPAYQRARKGIAYTFQITSIYPELSTLENVLIATQNNQGDGQSSATLEECATLNLEKMGLSAMADQKAGEIAYGHQRLLEVAMGLALNPSLLILDEPTQGLSDSEIENFCALIKEVGQTATVLLIEHNMPVVMELADKITVLNFGKILAEGSPDEIRQNNLVQAAYLGG